MNTINNQSINDAARVLAREKQKKLNHALRKSSEDIFGSCARCKNPIPIGRLMLHPESNRCVYCADR